MNWRLIAFFAACVITGCAMPVKEEPRKPEFPKLRLVPSDPVLYRVFPSDHCQGRDPVTFKCPQRGNDWRKK